MSLGLGTSLSKGGLATPGIVTDSLVLKHNYAAGGVVPVSDGAALFDASDERIDVGTDIQSTFNASFSISAWIKPTDGQPSGSQCIIGSINSTDQDDVAISLETSGKIRFLYKANNDPLAILESSASFSDGAVDWTHVAITIDSSVADPIIASGVKTYINGVSTANAIESGLEHITVSNMNAYSSTAELTIGVRNNESGTPAFDSDYAGYICNVGLWSAALTQPQIKSIMWKNYAGLTSSETENLVSWWNLDSTIDDDGGAKIVYDNHDTTYGSELNRNLGSADQWTEYNTNSVDLDDGAIHITGDGSDPSGAYIYLNDSTGDGCLSSDLTVGQAYKFTCSAIKVGSGDSVGIKIDSTADTTTADITSTTYEEINIYFVADHETGMLLNFVNLGSGEEIWLKDFSFKPFDGNPGELK